MERCPAPWSDGVGGICGGGGSGGGLGSMPGCDCMASAPLGIWCIGLNVDEAALSPNCAGGGGCCPWLAAWLAACAGGGGGALLAVYVGKFGSDACGG